MSLETNKVNTLLLTRDTLEAAMKDWTKQNEGPIGYEYISLLVNNGNVLDALERVSTSMMVKQISFNTSDACLIWTAHMNMQEYGTPGFSVLPDEGFSTSL